MDVIQAHPDCPPFAIFCAVGRPHFNYSKGSFSFTLIAVGFLEPLAQRVVFCIQQSAAGAAPKAALEQRFTTKKGTLFMPELPLTRIAHHVVMTLRTH